jgi:hypothetical protein
MNKVIELVENSLEYYDTNYEKYASFYNNIKFVKIEKTKDQGEIIFYNSDKKEIFRSRYEILGTFISKSSTWIWAWAQANYNKQLTYISRSLLKYGTELDSNPQNIFLKSELINSRYKISNYIQLEMHNAIAAYLSKQPLIYKYNIYYIPEFSENKDKLIDVTQFKDNDSFTSYYLFLLDYDKLKLS